MVSDKFKRSLTINGVLLVTDIAAGLILYNYGKSKGSKVSFSVPPRTEFLKMCGVAAVTSVLTGAAITKIENSLDVEIFDVKLGLGVAPLLKLEDGFEAKDLLKLPFLRGFDDCFSITTEFFP